MKRLILILVILLLLPLVPLSPNGAESLLVALGKRSAVLLAFLTILIVWAFILADANPYLRYLNEIELNLHMTLWGGLLIMMGWFGSFLAKIFHKKPEEASPA